MAIKRKKQSKSAAAKSAPWSLRICSVAARALYGATSTSRSTHGAPVPDGSDCGHSGGSLPTAVPSGEIQGRAAAQEVTANREKPSEKSAVKVAGRSFGHNPT